MKHISKRKKGIMYHYFDGVLMHPTYDLGTNEDIERHKMRNYFDKDNARLFYKSIQEILKTVE